MATSFETVMRPAAGTGARARSLRRTGLTLGGVGLGIAGLSVLASINAGSLASADAAPDELSTSIVLAFGLAVTGFATIKLGIGLILLGIVRRLWVRVDAVTGSLPALITASSTSQVQTGEYESEHGPAIATTEPPPTLPIHRVARLLWAPMLVMGVMLVMIGFLADLVAAGGSSTGTSAFAWAQGLLFLGETSLLAGISFLLATILGAIRTGGGEVQSSVGVTVKTLRMPSTAKLFVGLMMAGVIVGLLQFLGYAAVALSGDAGSSAGTFASLGPFREFGLGLLLSAIVLALATIAKALGFQFDRITEIITSGR